MIDLGIQAVWPETWGWLIEFRDGKIWEKNHGSSTWHGSSNSGSSSDADRSGSGGPDGNPTGCGPATSGFDGHD